MPSLPPVSMDLSGLYISAVDPGFLEGGSNSPRGDSFSTFYLIFPNFPHENETIGSKSATASLQNYE